jgi:predicted O-methyltransferase YrrM
MKKTLFLFFLFSLMMLHADSQWDNIKNQVSNEISNYQGWCSKEKASFMMDHIRLQKPQLCVEIGVFGGASLSVIAKTLKYNQYGTVIAIDAWSNSECVKGYEPKTNFYDWWSKVDLKRIHQDFVTQLKKDKIFDICYIVKKPSQEALNLIADESIDFLHIDGNHSENSAFFDVCNYLPKVKKGGFILLNDVNWPSMTKAFMYLLQNCELCSLYSDSTPFLLFKKI